MECDGRMSPTSVGFHSLMGGDLEDEVPLKMLEAGNSHGELLKVKVETRRFFMMTSLDSSSTLLLYEKPAPRKWSM